MAADRSLGFIRHTFGPPMKPPQIGVFEGFHPLIKSNIKESPRVPGCHGVSWGGSVNIAISAIAYLLCCFGPTCSVY